jgi:hypothetical protein
MKRAIRISLWVGIAALSLGTWAVGQTSVTLTAPGPGPSYDGIYVSPYYATVGGVANTPVVCDDFGDESTLSTWTATVTPFSGSSAPTNTSWSLAGKTLTQYDAVAWLTLQVLQQTSGSTGQIIDTFANWAVFDPSGVASYLLNNPVTTGLTTAQLCTDIFGTAGCSTTWVPADGGLLATAYGAPVPSGGYNLEIISPDTPGTTNVCKAETGCTAQEFIAVSVPEGGAAFGYLLLAGLCCFGAMFARSRRQIGSVSAA